jgi:ADP-ribose pyrophosphatase YjhB (NUDIX family)
MSVRPDLVSCWIFRLTSEHEIEVLLLRRSQGHTFPGIWQCVTGGLEGDEQVIDGILREVAEETGLAPADIEVFYGLDQVNHFYSDYIGEIVAEAVFAAHVRETAEPRISEEHDDMRWVAHAAARELVVWPAYRFALDQIEWLVEHPQHEPWLRSGAWAIEGLPQPPPEPSSR